MKHLLYEFRLGGPPLAMGLGILTVYAKDTRPEGWGTRPYARESLENR